MNKPLKGSYTPTILDNRVPYALRYYHQYIRDWLDYSGKIQKQLGFYMHLGGGDVDRDEFPIPTCLTEVLSESVKKSYFSYTHQLGNPFVRDVIAKYENYIQGINRFTENNVAMVLSSTGGFSMSLKVLLQHYKYKGNAILVQPAYPVYEGVLWKKFKIVKVCGKEDRGFLPTIEDIENSIDSETRFIILTNPSFPFGKFFSETELERLVTLSNEKKIYIIVDEIFYDMGFKPVPNIGSVNQNQDYIIRVKAFSKDRAAPGIRMGYVLGSEALMNELNLIVDTSYTCPPTVFDNFIVKDILLRTLMKGGYDIDDSRKKENSREFEIIGNYSKELPQYTREVKETISEYIDYRDLVLSELKASPYIKAIVPDAGINMGLKIDHTGTTYDFFKKMFFNTGVVLAPGEAFDMPKDCGNWYRLTFTNNKEKMVEALHRVIKFVADENKKSR